MTVYYQVKQADGQVRGTVMLREEHMQDWSVSTEEVFEKAIENTLRSEGLYWNSMDAVLRREKLLLFPEKLPESRTGMIVLSGKTGIWGATAAFLPGTAARIYEALGEAFYFLPSSIHEVIIVPFSHAVGGKYLAQTVKDINHMEIPAEEILSDHIYLYNVQTGQMEIVEDTE
ncbi:MAG: DUF5688 family protein [Lachnospiraceae bacterium]|nr:DUF5688 family protein [Lachnospiraceae bacterium]